MLLLCPLVLSVLPVIWGCHHCHRSHKTAMKTEEMLTWISILKGRRKSPYLSVYLTLGLTAKHQQPPSPLRMPPQALRQPWLGTSSVSSWLQRLSGSSGWRWDESQKKILADVSLFEFISPSLKVLCWIVSVYDLVVGFFLYQPIKWYNNLR